MRWLLLLAFAVTVPAFVALVAWWSRRVDGRDDGGPPRPRGAAAHDSRATRDAAGRRRAVGPTRLAPRIGARARVVSRRTRRTPSDHEVDHAHARQG